MSIQRTGNCRNYNILEKLPFIFSILKRTDTLFYFIIANTNSKNHPHSVETTNSIFYISAYRKPSSSSIQRQISDWTQLECKLQNVNLNQIIQPSTEVQQQYIVNNQNKPTENLSKDGTDPCNAGVPTVECTMNG